MKRASSCGPLRLFACVRLRGLRAGKAVAGRRASLRFRRSARCAVRLPCAARHCGPVAQLAALGQARRVRSRGALRARAAPPVLLGAAIRCARRPATALQSTVASLVRAGPPANTSRRCWAKGWAGRPRSEFWRRGAQASRPARAQRAPRELTRGICLSAAPAGREASCAAGREAEHRRAACAQRRPPKLERSGLAALPFARPDLRTAGVERPQRAASRHGGRVKRAGAAGMTPPTAARPCARRPPSGPAAARSRRRSTCARSARARRSPRACGRARPARAPRRR